MVWVGLSRKNASANMARRCLLFQALSQLDALRMGKNILVRETGEVEPDPVGEEAKAGLRQLFAAFAREHDIEPLFERMEMEDIGGRIGNLRFAQFRRTPIGDCCCLDSSCPRTSRTRSFSPCLSV